ncbi:MAG: MBOAT family protein [Eubacteriales bacterium]|nr:MBOAT family protein [Eubacteriales bacterium]
MVFSSLVFICVFLPAVFLLYYIMPGRRMKNMLLIVASLLFYSYGEPVYIILMLFSILFNYLMGIGVERTRSQRKFVLTLAVLGNLGMLGFFKYAVFVIGNLNQIFGIDIPVPEIRLPIGISFFTFQALSYVIDVYREQGKAQKNLWKLILYISFFPQLIAGPIVKYHDIEEQLDHRKENLDDIRAGMARFILGLGKKVLIANTMAVAADAVFSLPVSSVNVCVSWLGAIAYMMQIYYDFSGYSDMAIGLGMMFGFYFKENFYHPYGAASIQDFWRRWHVSLSTWFKEYLYIPLGGNRKGKVRTCVNKIIVFFLTGLWHGANWTFVLWGLYHGFFLLLEQFLPKKKVFSPLRHLYTVLVVCVGFVIFRAESLSQAFMMITKMFTDFRMDAVSMSIFWEQMTPLFIVTLAAAILFSIPVRERIVSAAAKNVMMKGAVTWIGLVGSVFILVLSVLNLAGGTYNPFIYFRF